jgi:hypothetical protein
VIAEKYFQQAGAATTHVTDRTSSGQRRAQGREPLADKHQQLHAQRTLQHASCTSLFYITRCCHWRDHHVTWRRTKSRNVCTVLMYIIRLNAQSTASVRNAGVTGYWRSIRVYVCMYICTYAYVLAEAVTCNLCMCMCSRYRIDTAYQQSVVTLNVSAGSRFVFFASISRSWTCSTESFEYV